MGSTADKLRAVDADFSKRLGASRIPGPSAVVTPQGVMMQMQITGQFPFKNMIGRETLPDEAILMMADEIDEEIKARGLKR
jgi:hypothetical protein